MQYSQNIGGLSRTTTILEELCEVIDMSRFTERLCQHTTITTLQRLGYIMECVLCEKEKADVIYERIKTLGKKMLYTPLSKEYSTDGVERNKRWKIIVNTEIETDEI